CTAAELGALVEEDVVAPDRGIGFGFGVRHPEVYQGEKFRWVPNGSVLHLTSPPDTTQTLMLEVEPGPNVECDAFTLEVRNPSGRLLARGPVEGRQRVYLSLPPTVGKHRAVFLYALHNKIRPNMDKWPELDFRIFRGDWVPSPARAPSDTTPNFAAEW